VVYGEPTERVSRSTPAMKDTVSLKAGPRQLQKLGDAGTGASDGRAVRIRASGRSGFLQIWLCRVTLVESVVSNALEAS